jgi:Ca-activated chloride channel family protein
VTVVALSFASPGYLLALGLIPLLGAAMLYSRRRRRRYAVRFPGVPTLAAVAGRGPGWRRRVPPLLLMLAIAALALALARPHDTVAVPVERASVMMILDTSRSMQATDVDPDRMRAAQESAERFLDRLPGQLQVGVVAFSDSPHTVLEPTRDRDQVRGTIAGLSADGGTATGDALNAALRVLPQRQGNKRPPPAAIVLLSDGATTTGADPVQAAREAGRRRVPVYTVALGTPDGTVPGPLGRPQPVPPDPATLRRMASASGGQAFAVDDADVLNSVYERLGSQIGTRPERREVTATFAAAGLLLLGAGAAAGLRWRGQIP